MTDTPESVLNALAGMAGLQALSQAFSDAVSEKIKAAPPGLMWTDNENGSGDYLQIESPRVALPYVLNQTRAGDFTSVVDDARREVEALPSWPKDGDLDSFLDAYCRERLLPGERPGREAILLFFFKKVRHKIVCWLGSSLSDITDDGPRFDLRPLGLEGSVVVRRLRADELVSPPPELGGNWAKRCPRQPGLVGEVVCHPTDWTDALRRKVVAGITLLLGVILSHEPGHRVTAPWLRLEAADRSGPVYRFYPSDEQTELWSRGRWLEEWPRRWNLIHDTQADDVRLTQSTRDRLDQACCGLVVARARDLNRCIPEYIAVLESLVGENGGATAYKIALRLSIWLDPVVVNSRLTRIAEFSRYQLFLFLRAMYGVRSTVVHGGRRDDYTYPLGGSSLKLLQIGRVLDVVTVCAMDRFFAGDVPSNWDEYIMSRVT